MSAIAKLVVPAVPTSEKPDEVLIHVRFAPSAEVLTIDATPDHLKPRDWFAHLYAGAVQHYQTLAGGRGFFRIPRARFEALVAECAK